MSEMPQVKQLAAPELRAMLERGDKFELVDVRSEAERAVAKIAPARSLDQALYDELIESDPAAPIVFMCHLGERSRAAAEHFRQQGFSNLYNLVGGIDAWSVLVDPSVPRY